MSTLPVGTIVFAILLKTLFGIAMIRCQCDITSQLVAALSRADQLDYPNGHQVSYPPNANCRWQISAPQSNCIRLNFTYLSTESGYDPDILTVYDGTTTSNRQIIKLSGDSIPQHYFYTFGSNALVHFVSDSDKYVGDGFILNYQAVPCECVANPPQNLQATANNVNVLDFMANKDENYNYPQSANCNWLVKAPDSMCIRFNFTYLSTESGYNPDTVAIYDGTTTSYRQIVIHHGDVHPTIYFYTSGPNALVNFISDADDEVSNGFTLDYIAVPCECYTNPPQNLQATANTVNVLDFMANKDKNYNYPQSANCNWLIAAPASMCIRFNFTYLSTESGYQPDTVTIYDGLSISYREITKVSGTTYPRTNFFTSDQSALIQFNSDGDINVGNGFTMQYEAVPASFCGKKEVCYIT